MIRGFFFAVYATIKNILCHLCKTTQLLDTFCLWSETGTIYLLKTDHLNFNQVTFNFIMFLNVFNVFTLIISDIRELKLFI